MGIAGTTAHWMHLRVLCYNHYEQIKSDWYKQFSLGLVDALPNISTDPPTKSYESERARCKILLAWHLLIS